MLQSLDTYFVPCYGQSAAAAAEQVAPAAGLEVLRQPRVPPAWSQQIPLSVGNTSPDQQTALGEHCSLYAAHAFQILQPALRPLQPFAQQLAWYARASGHKKTCRKCLCERACNNMLPLLPTLKLATG